MPILDFWRFQKAFEQVRRSDLSIRRNVPSQPQTCGFSVFPPPTSQVTSSKLRFSSKSFVNMK
jgi:hypothetical protein